MSTVMTRGETKMNVASINFEVKQFGEPEDRTLRFIGSDETPDRDGDVISVDGWDVNNYVKNPVFLWAHDYSIPPVGKATNVYRDSGKLLFDIKFPDTGIYPFADLVYNLYKGGFLNATSVGFIGREAIARDDEAVKDLPEWRRGVKFQRQELLELSAVPIPSNPAAIQQAKSLGVVTDDEYSSLMSFINGEFVSNPHVGAKTLKGIKSVYEARNTLDDKKEEDDMSVEEVKKEAEAAAQKARGEKGAPQPAYKLLVDNAENKTYITDVTTGKVLGDISEQIKNLVDTAVSKALENLTVEEKAGASVSKQNKSRLSQAKDLIIEVLGEVETETSTSEAKDPAVLEDEEELNKPEDLNMDGKDKSATKKKSVEDDPKEKENEKPSEKFDIGLLKDDDEITINFNVEDAE